MSESFVVEAEPRTDLGKGASRRLRREGKVPGVIYGTGKEPASIRHTSEKRKQLLASLMRVSSRPTRCTMI